MGSEPDGGVAFLSFLSVPVGRKAEGLVGLESSVRRESLITENRDIEPGMAGL